VHRKQGEGGEVVKEDEAWLGQCELMEVMGRFGGERGVGDRERQGPPGSELFPSKRETPFVPDMRDPPTQARPTCRCKVHGVILLCTFVCVTETQAPPVGAGFMAKSSSVLHGSTYFVF